MRPTADCPGHACRANVSLMIATHGAPSRSESRNARPSTIGMSMVSKYSGDTTSQSASKRPSPRGPVDAGDAHAAEAEAAALQRNHPRVRDRLDAGDRRAAAPRIAPPAPPPAARDSRRATRRRRRSGCSRSGIRDRCRAAFSSERRNRNAVTTSINDSATCAATSELRSRKRLRSAVALAPCSIGARSAPSA